MREVPVPPFGYTMITEGKLHRGDLVWDIEVKSWGHPKRNDYECLGTDIKFYYYVCRKEQKV